jgi:hypothetical protein
MNFVFAIALLIASYAITALTSKNTKAKDAVPASLADFQFPQHDEGTAQPVIFGECWTSDWMVLYYGNLSTEAIRAKKSGGKK